MYLRKQSGSIVPFLGVAISLISLNFSNAAVVPNPTEGDIFLAFRADAEPGKGKSYVVKLGQDSLYKVGGSFNVSGLGSIGEDLAETFGPSWASRADLHWSVFGERVSTTATPVVYATRERVSTILPSIPWPALNNQERSGTSTWISSFVNGIYGYRSSVATAHSPVATIQDPDQTRFSNYATQADTRSKNGEDGNTKALTAGSSQFGGFSRWDHKHGNIEGDFGNGTSGSSLDFYQIAESGVSRLGTFWLDDLGTLSFALLSEIAPSLDSDGDGVSDLAEIEAGTDRNDVTDYLRIGSFAQTPSGPHLTAVTVADKAYQLEYSENLSSWLAIAFHAAGPEAEAFDFTDTNTVRNSKPKGFYRFRVAP